MPSQRHIRQLEAASDIIMPFVPIATGADRGRFVLVMGSVSDTRLAGVNLSACQAGELGRRSVVFWQAF